jgi:hypothetical protein
METKTYYLAWYWRIIYGGLGVALAIVAPLGIFRDSVVDFSRGTIHWSMLIFNGLVITLFLFIGITTFLAALRMRLVLSTQGIEFHHSSFSLYASWSDAARIDRVMFGRSRVDGLVLRQSSLRADRLTRWTLKLWGQDLEIPLQPFSWRWRTSELGDDLRRYAPQLGL